MSDRDRVAVDQVLRGLTLDQRRALFERLRAEFPIHPLEADWNASAEVILEAIRRSSSLTQRGVRGIIAEACFYTDVVQPLLKHGWEDFAPTGDVPYDFGIRDHAGDVRIQIKLQRSRNREPMKADQVGRPIGFSAACFVVETQKTRGGTRGGQSTRPYRFGEFDILGVSLYPSLHDWSKFLYTVAAWLIPDPKNGDLIFKYQPVPPKPNAEWTDNLLECITWLREGDARRIRLSP